MKKYTKKQIEEFLRESNAIEQEYSKEALEDAHVAWHYIMGVEEMTPAVILETHRLFARRLRPDIAGQLRNCAVRIGGEIKKDLGRDFLMSRLEDICKIIKSTIEATPTADKMPKEDALILKTEVAKQLHIVFEDLHPFNDFNGRVGRAVTNWHCMKMGIPIFIIHADWDTGGEEQRNYYSWFRQK